MAYFQGYKLGYGMGYKAGFEGQPAELIDRDVLQPLRQIRLPEEFLKTLIEGLRDGHRKGFEKMRS